jgi:hypothetical protein
MDTEQDAVPAIAAATSWQVGETTVIVLFAVNPTIPVGVDGADEVSVTVAVQVVGVPTVTELGEH